MRGWDSLSDGAAEFWLYKNPFRKCLCKGNSMEMERKIRWKSALCLFAFVQSSFTVEKGGKCVNFFLVNIWIFDRGSDKSIVAEEEAC